ncbi:MAG: hypothetical protein ACFE8B_11715 [Candidatus Hermodarchaeota archaeon]
MLEDNLNDKVSDLNDEIFALKRRISVLEAELDKKEQENYAHLETIEYLEDVIIKLESLIPEQEDEQKSKKQKVVDSKLKLEIEDKDRQIRDLKNRMGFLRKEKVQIQQELEKLKAEHSESNVIRPEDIRSKPPLEILVKELQDKVNRQKSIIETMKRESIDISEFDTKVKEKEEAIERKMAYLLQNKIDELMKLTESKNEEIKNLQNGTKDLRSKLEVLEVQLNIKDQKINELNKSLSKTKKKKQ